LPPLSDIDIIISAIFCCLISLPPLSMMPPCRRLTLPLIISPLRHATPASALLPGAQAQRVRHWLIFAIFTPWLIFATPRCHDYLPPTLRRHCHLRRYADIVFDAIDCIADYFTPAITPLLRFSYAFDAFSFRHFTFARRKVCGVR
jgi:hypothetical protein